MCLKVIFLVLTTIIVSQCTHIHRNNSITPVDWENDGKSSLVFVFDTTGSMYDDLKQLREGAEMVLNTAMEESNIIGDFVFVPFHDPGVGPATVTRDKAVFHQALDLVDVYGGGGCPEKSLGGIKLALSVSAPRSFIYVFTDATADDHSLVGDVLDAVQRKQTQVVFVLTGHCNDLDKPSYKVYQQIAAASSGQIFNLNKTSVHKVLDFVRTSIKGRTVNLGSSINPAGYNNTQAVIPVDSTLGEISVSVSGARPQISVVNPQGAVLTGPPQLLTTLDLNEIMVVKVLQPEPGNWSISVGSEDPFSVRVVGLSDLSFTHGFTRHPPKTMAATNYRPYKGTYNHMMIAITGSDSPVEVGYAEIVSLSGATLFEVPLTKMADNLYKARAFIPPDDLFYIAINGKDEHNQELRRIGATAIQAKRPDAPYLTVFHKVSARSHSRVVLKCKVESLVPIIAIWTKDSANIQEPTSSLETTTIEYIIEDMGEADVATYRCVARNIAGATKAATDLVLIVDPPIVKVMPTHLTLENGDNATIACTVISESLITTFQIISENNGSRDVIDVATEPNFEGIYTHSYTVSEEGNYTCVAANRGGSLNQTSQVYYIPKPTAKIQGANKLSLNQYGNATIRCTVTYASDISWAIDGTVVKKSMVNGSFIDVLVHNVSDDGVWTCTAKRGRFQATDSITVSILIQPTVTIQGPKNVTVLNGTVYELFCKVKAKPAPEVIWYRDNEENLLNDTMISIDDRNYLSTLKLNSSTQNIEGTYNCAAGTRRDNVTVHARRKMVITQMNNETIVPLYHSTKLMCVVDSHPLPIITWRHNDTEVFNTTNTYVTKDKSTVYIERVDFENLGVYSCEADNGFEKMVVEQSLRVDKLEKPILVKDPVKRVVKEGQSTIITCRVLQGEPDPTLTLQYKNNTSNNFTALDLAENTLNFTIGYISANMSGVYRCIAENVVGKDVYDMEMIVQYPPQLKIPQSNEDKPLEVKAGERLTLSCAAVGTPSPVVVWTKDGWPMLYNKHTYLSAVNDLVMEAVTEYDSGLFACHVSNPLGSVMKNFTLYVYVHPQIFLPNVTTEHEILEGQLVELPCEATGVPAPTVIWRHNGNDVIDGKKYVDAFGIRFVANLTDFGDYTCVAENKYGRTNLTYNIFVWVPPYIEPPHRVTKNVLKGNNVTLQCDVVGFPLPTITWQLEEQPVIANTTDISYNGVGNLYITNASSSHEGAYVCVAENIAGGATKVIRVNVYEPPKILEDKYTGPYLATNKDSAIVISCRVSGKPKPYVIWIKEELYLDKDERYDVRTDGSLLINSPSEDMSGNYTCIAKNVLGNVSKTVEVKVYSVPTQMQSEESQPVVTVLEHSTTSVQCPAQTSGSDAVKWYKDASLLSIGNLQISKVTREDQSKYACVVTNAIGSSYAAIKLNIEWPPRFIDNTEDIDSENSVRDDGILKNDNGLVDQFTNLKNLSESIENTEGNVNNVEEVVENGAEARNDSTNYNISKDFGHKRHGNNNINNNEKDEFLNDRKAITENTIEENINHSERSTNKESTKKSSNNGKVIEVVKGYDTYLDCSFDSKPIAKIKWLFNSKPIVFANKQQYKILNTQTHQSGAYKCIVGNVHGTIVKEFQLSVMEPPFISEFNEMHVLLMSGSEASLECNAKGSPQPNISWTFNNTNWLQTNSTLTNTNITLQSEGMYRCDARNRAGAAHIVYKVDVVTRAVVTDVVAFTGELGSSVVATVEAVKGSHIHIACNATGNPTPFIQWIRYGKVLAENREGISYADLTLDGVDTFQNGAYSCIASNEGGSDERKISLEVLEPPSIFQTIFDTSGNTIDLEVLSGQAYYMHCHVTGNPAPEIYWFRDGLPLMFFDDSMISTDFGEVIAVKSAREDQSGNYTCVARNKIGNTSIVYLVDVLVPPPQPKESSISISLRVGATLTLQCPIEGSPRPTVAWHKQPYTVIGQNTARAQLTDDNVTLTITKVQVSDSGNYSCLMTNTVGVTELTYDVTVLSPPSVGGAAIDVIERHLVALGKSLVLKCEVDGHPFPTIKWLKDIQEVSNKSSNVHRTLGQSVLAVWGTRARDAGQYICVAENAVGTAYRRYQLTVSVPGKWSPWGEWSFCNVTCGGGRQQRTRVCRYIDDDNNIMDKSNQSDKLVLDESACKGPAVDMRKCHMPPCEDGNSAWSPWSAWSSCSASCGAGTQARSRRCLKTRCRGDNVQIRKCPKQPQCERSDASDENEPLDHFEENNTHSILFAAESVFEVEPEVLETQHSLEVEQFNTRTEMPAWHEVVASGNIDGSRRGRCPPGYTHHVRNDTCEDINECLLTNNQCHASQLCANTMGGHRCGCAPGFASLTAGERCMDINECSQGISGCAFSCVNVAGGYVCACPAHLRLAADKHHCYSPAVYRNPYSFKKQDGGHRSASEHPGPRRIRVN